MTILPTSRRMRPRPSHLAGLLLVFFAGPASADDFQLENVRLDLGKFVLTIPKLDVKGTPLDRNAFLSILQSGGSESPVARMSRLNATEVSAPTLVVEQNFGGQKQTTTYRDIRFSDIREGRVSRGDSTGASFTVDGAPSGKLSGEMKRMSFEILDLAQIARVFSEKAQPGSNPDMKVIYGRIEQDGYALDLGELGKMTMGKASLTNFKARLGPEPLGDVLSRFVTLTEEAEKAESNPNSKEDPALTRAREKQLFATVIAMVDAVDYGSGEFRDIAMTITQPPKPGAKPAAKAEPADIRFSRLAFGEFTPEKSGFVLEGLQFEGGGGKGTIASIGASGFSFEPVLNEFRTAIADPAFDPKTMDFRKMIPTLGSLRLAGLQVDVPQEAPKGRTAAPVRVGLGSFEIRSGEQLNGIPTALTLTMDRLTVPVVESPSAPSAKDLLAMGYRNLDLSAKIDLAWEAATSELAIRSLSLGGVGMAQLDATGRLGNIGKDAFSSDLALAQLALLGATAKGLDVKLRNLGLVDKLIENEARKSNRKPEQVRREYSAIAAIGLASILGPSEGAKTLAGAISRFVAKPSVLSASATSRVPGGLGLADVIMLTDPTEIFEKIDVKAETE